MINLLPPKEQGELLLKKNQRLVIVLGNTVVITVFCLILVLVAVKFYILQRARDYHVNFVNREAQYASEEFANLKNIIQNYNATLAKADTFYKKQSYISDSLKTILQVQRSQGLHVESIIIKQGRDRSVDAITISGVADDRDDLLVFKKNIENSQSIKNINFPPENWVKPTEVNFYLTFDIEQSI